MSCLDVSAAILVFVCIHCLPKCFYAQVFKRYKITKRDLPIRSPAKRRQTFFSLMKQKGVNKGGQFKLNVS